MRSLSVARWVGLIVGILLFLLGAVWALQGVGLLLGSPMTGVSFWMWVGLVLAIVGIVLILVSWRRAR